MPNNNVAIVGTVGVPANYGGFETLAENLVKFHDAASLPDSITVYCSSKSYPSRKPTFLSARLKYCPLHANGAQSIPYDIVSLFSAVWNRSDAILVLGISGAIALPLVRLVSSARIITNIDGIEWRREKWKGWARRFLRFSEKIAMRVSHEVIADNAAIAEYVAQTYSLKCHVIAYGGDHAIAVDEVAVTERALPDSYAIAVCRIEPENNVQMVLEAFAKVTSHALVMVGNWSNSAYGRALREQYTTCNNLFLLNSIYDLGKLKYLRSRASFYIHGHSAGGTNPSLVEAMHFGKAILAFDCNYNRNTTENSALFFKNSDELGRLVETIELAVAEKVGGDMAKIAKRRYTWTIVAQQYFALLGT